MGRVSDHPYGLVAAAGEQALQQECDLPMPARDHYTHAASLRTHHRAAWLKVSDVLPGLPTPQPDLCAALGMYLRPAHAPPYSVEASRAMLAVACLHGDLTPTQTRTSHS